MRHQLHCRTKPPRILPPNPIIKNKRPRSTLTNNEEGSRGSSGEAAGILAHWEQMELQHPPNKFVPIILWGTRVSSYFPCGWKTLFCRNGFTVPSRHLRNKYRQELHDDILVRVKIAMQEAEMTLLFTIGNLPQPFSFVWLCHLMVEEHPWIQIYFLLADGDALGWGTTIFEYVQSVVKNQCVIDNTIVEHKWWERIKDGNNK